MMPVVAAALVTGLCAMTTATAPAEAAVKLCRQPVIGDIVEKPSQRDALKGAIDSWRRKTEVHGPRYGNWRLARGRRNSCARLPSGLYTCVAVGQPCTIRQVPPPRGFGDRVKPPRLRPLPSLPHPPPPPGARPRAVPGATDKPRPI